MTARVSPDMESNACGVTKYIMIYFIDFVYTFYLEFELDLLFYHLSMWLSFLYYMCVLHMCCWEDFSCFFSSSYLRVTRERETIGNRKKMPLFIKDFPNTKCTKKMLNGRDTLIKKYIYNLPLCSILNCPFSSLILSSTLFTYILSLPHEMRYTQKRKRIKERSIVFSFSISSIL